jgi:hypothetical protein
MNMKLVMGVIALSLIAGVSNAHADNHGLRLGTPAALGTGCPTPDSVMAIVSPDESTISVLFSQFQAEAGFSSPSGKQLDRKACSLAIPVIVPQGFQVSIISTDYRGFNLVPAGGRNRINTEYFWAGIRGPRFTKDFYGPSSTDFTTSNAVAVSSVVFAPCGASVTLRVNTDITSISNRNGDQTMMTVDSADISSALQYKLAWRSCN